MARSVGTLVNKDTSKDTKTSSFSCCVKMNSAKSFELLTAEDVLSINELRMNERCLIADMFVKCQKTQ